MRRCRSESLVSHFCPRIFCVFSTVQYPRGYSLGPPLGMPSYHSLCVLQALLHLSGPLQAQPSLICSKVTKILCPAALLIHRDCCWTKKNFISTAWDSRTGQGNCFGCQSVSRAIIADRTIIVHRISACLIRPHRTDLLHDQAPVSGCWLGT